MKLNLRNFRSLTVLDSALYALDSGLQSLAEFRIRIPCAELRIPKSRIPDFTSKNLMEL